MSSNFELTCFLNTGISFTFHPMRMKGVLILTVRRMQSRLDRYHLGFGSIERIIDTSGIEYKFNLNVHTITFERKVAK